MCLIINKENHPEYKPIILKKELRVYKILCGIRHPRGAKYLETNSSPVQFFTYLPKTLYKTKMSKSKPLLDGAVYDKYSTLREINKGFHAFILKADARDNNNMFPDKNNKICSFYYPKGTMVYYGIHGDIVGDQIKSGTLKRLK